jgi:hypothetical protein
MASALRDFGPGIWIAAGPTVVAAAGFHYPTRMAAIRLASGGIFVWSPTALTGDLRAAVDAIGPVRCIVAPNSLHHVFVSDWKAAYPGAKVFAAPGLSSKRKDIVFDAELGDAAPAEWAGEIEQVVVRGNAITTEVVFFHHASGTAIFTDLIQQFAPGWFSGWRSLVARLDRMVSPEPTVPRKFRLAFTDRSAARASIGNILDWPTQRVLMAHGEPVTTGGRAAIAKAFAWLVQSGAA